MRTPSTCSIVALSVLVLIVTSARVRASDAPTDIIATGPTASSDRDAIDAALALLPSRPDRIAVLDVSQNRPEVRSYLLTLDAFTVKGNGVIYVVQQSEVLMRARSGALLFRAMLATILWHEMAHLAGEDEHGARTAEEDLWKQFVRDGVADEVTSLRYLDALRRRPDDMLMASR